MKKKWIPANLIGLLVVSFLLVSANPASARKEDPVRYVVTLGTFASPPLSTPVHFDSATRVYVSSFRRGGKKLYRLRLGFYSSREDAEEALVTIKNDYPNAWTTRVTKREKKQVLSGKLESVPYVAGR